ncbi:MAG: hypothetical protein JNL49_12575 [Bacteroidia bacterium]|nr:hypothetical protein [Bacteroidia bacterium]
MKIKNPYRHTQLNKQYSFAGGVQDFLDAISYCKGVQITRIHSNQFRISAMVSVGVLIMEGNPSFTDPISVEFTVMDNPDSGSTLLVTTDIREEHYFVSFIFLVFFGFSFYLQFPFLAVFGIIIGGIITQWWFFNILRMQEMAIVEDVLKKLKIFELHYL